MLVHAAVDLRNCRVGERFGAGVCNHADDRGPRRLRRRWHLAGIQAQTNAFAQRVLIGPPGASRGLIDDRHLGRFGNVLVGEKASAQQRDAQQAKVFGRNDWTINFRCQIFRSLDAFADHRQREGLAVAQGKRRRVADSGFFYARQGSAAPKNFAQQN